MRWLLLLFGLALASAPPAQAQEGDTELEATLGEVGEVYARAYTQPLADMLGADLNAGLFHTARVKRLGLNLYVGISGAAVMIPASSRSFTLSYSGRVDVEVDEGPIRNKTLNVPATFEARDAPTIFGDEAEPLVEYQSRYDTTVTYLGITLPVSIDEVGQIETIGGLAHLNLIGAPVLHMRFGSVLGTDLLVRWVPKSLVDQGIQLAGGEPEEVGSAELAGVGVRHGLNTYLPLLPLDVAIQVLWQRAHLEEDEQEILRVTTFAASVQASKQWRFVSVYGGLQTEESRLRVKYTFEEQGIAVPVDFTLTGALKTRFVLGAGLHLGPVLVNAGATFGAFTVYTGGIGLAI